MKSINTKRHKETERQRETERNIDTEREKLCSLDAQVHLGCM